MKSIEELKELAYTYYPKGMSPGDSGYENTLQAKKLVLAHKNNSTEAIKHLDAICREIIALYPEIRVEDLGPLIKSGHSAKAKFFLPEKPLTAVMLYISFLEPLYLIYESEQVYSSKDLEYIRNNLHVKDSVSDHYQSLTQSIDQKVVLRLPYYQKLSYEDFRTPLNNVSYGNYGDVYPSRILKKMTLFNAFFDNNYY